MRVRSKSSDDWRIEDAGGSLRAILDALRPNFGNLLLRAQRTRDRAPRSGNFLPSRWARALDSDPCNVVNLHWVGGETLSIEDIGAINKPVVWTLHDMWPFCGTEHVTSYDADAAWRRGYGGPGGRQRPLFSIDLDKRVWNRKRRRFSRMMHIVAPSRWLADCARESMLFGEFPVSVIPNPLDVSVFRPLQREFSRDALRLPQDRQLLLFGAVGGTGDRNKGWDLLLSALNRLGTTPGLREKVACVVFGQGAPQHEPECPFPIFWAGRIADDTTLALFYNAADVTIVPSRQENLPQIATEAQACGCPVVAFGTTGLPDVVAHRETGYLAAPFDCDDLAAGVAWVLDKANQSTSLRIMSRRRAEALWRSELVVEKYLAKYQEAIELGRG